MNGDGAAWIMAPTSGILHVAGEGFPRRDCAEGTRVLCGWVLTANPKTVVPLDRRSDPRIGKKCRRCEQWIAKEAARG